MLQDFLSDVELYYSNIVVDEMIEIIGEEYHHISDVMRHKVNDEIFVTDGLGKIYATRITEIEKKSLFTRIISAKSYDEKLKNITFCIPRLRSADRFEFALEKCVELGITNFIVFDSNRTVAKGEKIDRWQKILTAAMKQSLRAWLPNISYKKNVEQIFLLEGIKIVFDQNAQQTIHSYLETNLQLDNTNRYFLFGPEGGFSEDELKMENSELRIKLTGNRLRSETAIIAAATELSLRSTQ